MLFRSPLGVTRKNASVATKPYSFWYPATQAFTPFKVTSEVGMEFYCSVNCILSSILWWKNASATSTTRSWRLWSQGSPGSLLATTTTSNEPVGTAQWIVATLSSPYSLTANTHYLASYQISNDYYSYSNPITYPYSVGNLTMTASRYNTTLGSYPATSDTSYNHWVDVIVNY